MAKKIKVYIAGRLNNPEQRHSLEKIDMICKELGFDTFLPHRDVGLLNDLKDVKKIFQGDITEGFKGCKILVALLDGLHVGAGTAWEIGYAYAKGVKVIAVKTDEPVEEAIDYLSAIIIGSSEIVTSIDRLKARLKELKLSI